MIGRSFYFFVEFRTYFAFVEPAALIYLIRQNQSFSEAEMKFFLSSIIGIVVMISASVTKAELNTIFLTEIPDGRIFQRFQGAADVTVSGIYTGFPTHIEYRIVHDGTNNPISGHDWQILASSPTGETFSGTAYEVPEGGWYNIDVRFSNDTGIKDEGINKWGVGILVGIIGQSNVSFWFDLGDDEIADPLLSVYDNGTWRSIESSGNGAIAFGNYIIANLTYPIPVGLLDYAVGGSALQAEAAVNYGFWADYDSAPYTTFISAVTAVGGYLEFVVWAQGENDAWFNAFTDYEMSLTDFIAKVREDVGNGSTEANLPFLVSLLGRGIWWNNDYSFQGIRNAQENVVNSGSDIYLASTTSDFPLRDIIHYTDEAYSIHGERCAQTILYLLDEEVYYRGPYISSAYVVDAIHTDVAITHRGGTDFTPVSGITGFEIANNGIWEIPSSADQIDATTIRLTHPPFDGSRTVRYLYGADPIVTHPVIDNTDMKLPLEGLDSLKVILPEPGVCEIDPDICSSPDSDGDGMVDTWELSNGLDPYDASDANFDSDGDGLTSLEEYSEGTQPQIPDTDSDGFEDGFDGYPLDNQQSSCLYPVRNYVNNEIFFSVQEAINDQNAADYDIIQLTAADFDESVLYDREIILVLYGGYYCSYSGNPSTTSVNSLLIQQGKIIIDNLVIQ